MRPFAPASFFLGVNYPWLNYGEDFGGGPSGHRGISRSENRQLIGQDFERIQDAGISVVRWFLFGDGRGGFVSEKGIPQKPDGFLLTDVAAALDAAQQHSLQLCFSLIDFLWLQDHAGKRPPHANEHLLHFAAGREAFLEEVLIPLFREFRAHPALFAWEIANEPEWAIREFHRARSAPLHFAEFRAYAAEIAQAAHEFGAARVTLGTARLIWVRAWMEASLDFYQAHYYPSAEKETRRDLAQQLASLGPLDQPLWLGELPARDPRTPSYRVQDALETSRNAGLAGAAVWRWTKPETKGADVEIGQVDPGDLKLWWERERGAAESA
jgi:hypothetical protein